MRRRRTEELLCIPGNCQHRRTFRAARFSGEIRRMVATTLLGRIPL